jgi:two-component system, OmpR family, response regulator
MTNAAPLTHADGSPTRALVVDDEVMLAELLTMALRYDGWDVRSAGSGTEAVRAARDFAPDVVLLDVMLPDIDGLEVLRRLRAHDPDVPVLFLTARDAVEDRIAGITAGGDDYVTKPFSLEEVIARIRAILRRAGSRVETASAQLCFADIELDDDTHEVRKAGELVELSPTEFKLLHYFMRNPGRVLSKTQILEHVWNYDFNGDTGVIESYVSYLRRKLDTGEPRLLHTVRGVGYVLRVPRS